MMGGRGGNRQMRRMMDKMGMDMEEVNNVQEVIIKTDKKEIIINKPAVTEMKTNELSCVFWECFEQFSAMATRMPTVQCRAKVLPCSTKSYLWQSMLCHARSLLCQSQGCTRFDSIQT